MKNEKWRTLAAPAADSVASPGISPAPVPPDDAGAVEGKRDSVERELRFSLKAFCAERYYADLIVSENDLDASPYDVDKMLIEDIYYTHAEVSDHFGDGSSLEKLRGDLLRGNILAATTDSLQLNVCKWRGRWRSLNNRRLRVLKDFEASQRQGQPSFRGEVQVRKRPLCKGTAAFIHSLCQEERLTGGGQQSTVHPDAEQARKTLSHIVNASLGNKDDGFYRGWAQCEFAESRMMPINQLTFAGASHRQRQTTAQAARPVAKRSTEMDFGQTQLERARQGLLVIDTVKFSGKTYFADQNLGKRLHAFQRQTGERFVVKTRLIPLCPWTAKMVLANSSRNNGDSVQSIGSLGDEWSLTRIVRLLVNLANALSQEPNLGGESDLQVQLLGGCILTWGLFKHLGGARMPR